MTMAATVDASRGLACRIAYILQCDKDTAFPKGKTRLELRGQPVLEGSSLKGELLPSLRWIPRGLSRVGEAPPKACRSSP